MVANLEFQAIAIANNLDKSVEDAVRQIAINGTGNLQKATPIDTRWAAANWIPRKGQPSDADGTPGTQTVEQRAAVQTRQIASIASYSLGDGKVFITNNTPYIQALNSGSSQQAPAGFVEKAIEEAVSEVNIG